MEPSGRGGQIAGGEEGLIRGVTGPEMASTSAPVGLGSRLGCQSGKTGDGMGEAGDAFASGRDEQGLGGAGGEPQKEAQTGGGS